MDTVSVEKALVRAKIAMMLDKRSAFISGVMLELNTKWDEAIPTACTNGADISFSPNFFAAQNSDAQLGLLIHETWHVALGHTDPDDLMGRCPKRLNRAQDFFINSMIVADGFVIPKGGCLNRDYDDLSIGEIYDLLEDDPDYDPDVVGGGDAEQGDPIEIEANRKEIVQRAAMRAKMGGFDLGTLPDDLGIRIEQSYNTAVPWEDCLQEFMGELAKDDYSYQKFNRKYLPDFYLPTLHSEAMSHLAFAMDLSYSVTDYEVARELGEIEYVKQTFNPNELTVMDFDTGIRSIHTLTESDSVSDISFKGRGGTKISPVLDWAIENNPTAMVIFTDGEFTPYEPKMPCPVLWIIINNPSFTSNIGRIVHATFDRESHS